MHRGTGLVLARLNQHDKFSLQSELSQSGALLGYRAMHLRLKQKYEIQISRLHHKQPSIASYVSCDLVSSA